MCDLAWLVAQCSLSLTEFVGFISMHELFEIGTLIDCMLKKTSTHPQRFPLLLLRYRRQPPRINFGDFYQGVINVLPSSKETFSVRLMVVEIGVWLMLGWFQSIFDLPTERKLTKYNLFWAMMVTTNSSYTLKTKPKRLSEFINQFLWHLEKS